MRATAPAGRPLAPHSRRTNGATIVPQASGGVVIVTLSAVALSSSPRPGSIPSTVAPAISQPAADESALSPNCCTPHSSPATEKCQPLPVLCCQAGKGQPSLWAIPRCCCMAT